MSKAYLVLDEMPNYCAQCELEFWAENEDEWMCPIGDGRVAATAVEHYNYKNRPVWCPLQPTPERRLEWYDGPEGDYERGWNACIGMTFGEDDDDDD